MNAFYECFVFRTSFFSEGPLLHFVPFIDYAVSWIFQITFRYTCNLNGFSAWCGISLKELVGYGRMSWDVPTDRPIDRQTDRQTE